MRSHRANLHQPPREADRRLRHRKVRITAPKPMAATHTDKAFERDLRDLREKLLAMGARVETQIAESVRALAERDSKLGEHAVYADAEVNRLEVEVDDLCRRILALRQPAASDLRLITTA